MKKRFFQTKTWALALTIVGCFSLITTSSLRAEAPYTMFAGHYKGDATFSYLYKGTEYTQETTVTEKWTDIQLRVGEWGLISGTATLEISYENETDAGNHEVTLKIPIVGKLDSGIHYHGAFGMRRTVNAAFLLGLRPIKGKFVGWPKTDWRRRFVLDNNDPNLIQASMTLWLDPNHS